MRVLVVCEASVEFLRCLSNRTIGLSQLNANFFRRELEVNLVTVIRFLLMLVHNASVGLL